MEIIIRNVVSVISRLLSSYDYRDRNRCPMMISVTLSSFTCISALIRNYCAIILCRSVLIRTDLCLMCIDFVFSLRDVCKRNWT